MLPTKFRVSWPFISGDFDLQVTPMLPISFESIGLSVQEILSPQCFLPSFESVDLSVQEKKQKQDFQVGRHLGFPIRTILAIFDLQVYFIYNIYYGFYQVSSQLAQGCRRSRLLKQLLTPHGA